MGKYKGEVCLLCVAIIWGTGFVATEIALGALSPFEILAVRFVVGACVLTAVFWRKFKALTKSALFRGVILGTLLYCSFLLQTVGLLYTTPSNNAFLTAVNVIIVPFIGIVFYRRRTDVFSVLGAMLAIAGVALISLTQQFTIGFGDTLTLLCAVGFAFQIFYTGEFLKRGDDAVTLAVLQLIVAAVLAVAVSLITGALGVEGTKGGVSLLQSLLSALYLGIFSTGAAYLMQTVAQRFTTETRAAVILCTESVFGTIASAIILGQLLSGRAVVGCVLILCAVLVAEIKPKIRTR